MTIEDVKGKHLSTAFTLVVFNYLKEIGELDDSRGSQLAMCSNSFLQEFHRNHPKAYTELSEEITSLYLTNGLDFNGEYVGKAVLFKDKIKEIKNRYDYRNDHNPTALENPMQVAYSVLGELEIFMRQAGILEDLSCTE